MAKQAHSSVTIFPLWGWGTDEGKNPSVFHFHSSIGHFLSSHLPIELSFAGPLFLHTASVPPTALRRELDAWKMYVGQQIIKGPPPNKTVKLLKEPEYGRCLLCPEERGGMCTTVYPYLHTHEGWKRWQGGYKNKRLMENNPKLQSLQDVTGRVHREDVITTRTPSPRGRHHHEQVKHRAAWQQ